jgi:hypothetical protein
MRHQVDPNTVGGLSLVFPGAGLAYMGLWGWAVAAFVTEVGLIRLIGLPTGHPVIVWLVLAILFSGATNQFAKYHNERLMAELVERLETPPPPPPSEPPPPPPPPVPSEPSSPPAVAGADAAMTMRFCPSCGTRNEGHRFCPQCGSSLQPARS